MLHAACSSMYPASLCALLLIFATALFLCAAMSQFCLCFHALCFSSFLPPLCVLHAACLSVLPALVRFTSRHVCRHSVCCVLPVSHCYLHHCTPYFLSFLAPLCVLHARCLSVTVTCCIARFPPSSLPPFCVLHASCLLVIMRCTSLSSCVT